MRLDVPSESDVRWDMVALGEIMLRLDPGEERITTTRNFRVWEGGGEYNVARALRRTFGLRTAVVTAFADNPIGHLLEDLILQGGVDTSHVRWVPYDGIGRTVRNGLNFTERGFGLRSAVGCSDRANSAASQLSPGAIDWKQVFRHEGVRWFHSGGIFAGLSDTTPEVIREASTEAHAAGAIVSFDLNFRESLWRARGGAAAAQEILADLVAGVDVLVGNEEDFIVALGLSAFGVDTGFKSIEPASYVKMLSEAAARFPNLRVIAVSLRTAHSASRNDWGGIVYADGEAFIGTFRPGLDVLDRVGSGDAVASGLFYGLLTGRTPQESLEIGLAHGALVMTTPGDTSMATKAEVERLVAGGNARVVR